MLEVLTGIISGSISGLGMGGGTILILILSSFLNVEQHVAQATNLIFFIPTAICAIIVNLKQKLIDIKLGIIIIISGSIGAVLGAILAMKIDANNLKMYFGIFLALISLNEIFWLVKEYIFDKIRHNKDKKINK